MKLKLTLVKSPIASIPNHVRVIEALGLRKINQEKIHYDTPIIRGMIFKVKHLIRVEEIAEEAKPAKKPRAPRKPKEPKEPVEPVAQQD